MGGFQMAKATLRSKYGAVKTTVDGYTFASRAEARRYEELMLLGLAGELDNLELQPVFPLVVNGVSVGRYVADFAYREKATGAFVVEDVKGMRTPVYQLKKKLVAACHGIDVREIRRSA